MTPKRRKIARLLAIVGIAAGALVATAPWWGVPLIGRPILEAKLREQLACPVELAGVRGSWSGVRVASLRIGQPAGFESVHEPLALVSGVDVQLSLLGALFGRIEPVVTVESLEAAVVRGADGITNIQRARKTKDPRDWTPPAASKPVGDARARAWGLAAKLVRGKVVLRDLAAGAEATIDRIVVEANRPREGGQLRFSLDCAVSGTRGAGGLSIGGVYDVETMSSSAELSAANFDLGAFAPLAASTKWVSTVEGLVNGSVKLSLAKDGEVTGDGNLVIANLRLDGGKLTAPIHDPSIVLTPKFTFAPRTGILSAEGFGLKSTAFSAEGSGRFGAESGGSADLTFHGDLRKAQETFAPFFPADARLEGTLAGKANIRADAAGPARLSASVDLRGLRARRESAGTASAGAGTDGSLFLEGTAERDLSAIRIEKGTLDFGPIAHATGSGGWRRTPAAPGPGQIDVDATFRASVAEAAARFAARLPARLTAAGELSGAARVTTSETQEIRWSVDADAKNLSLACRGGAPPDAEPEWVRALEFSPVAESLVSVRAAGSRDPRFERFELSRLEVDTSSGALRAHATAEGSWRNLASSLRAKAHVESRLDKLAPYATAYLPRRLRLTGDLSADLDIQGENGRVRGPVAIAARGLTITARPALEGERSALDAALDKLVSAPMRLAEARIHGTLEGDQRTKAGTIPNFRIETRERVLDVAGAVTFAMAGAQDDAPTFRFEGKAESDLAPLLAFAAPFAAPGAGAPRPMAEGSAVIEGKVAFERAPTGARAIEFEAAGELGGLAKAAAAFSGRPVDLQGRWKGSGRHAIDAKGTREFRFAATVADLRGAGPEGELEKELGFETKGSYAWIDKEFVFHLDSADLTTASGRARLEASARGGVRDKALSGVGRVEWRADLPWLGAIAAFALPAGARPQGDFGGAISLDTVDGATKVGGSVKVGKFRWLGTGSDGSPPAVDLELELAATLEHASGELKVVTLEARSSDRSIEAKLSRGSVRGLRAGAGPVECEAEWDASVDGAGAGRLIEAWLPKNWRLEGPGRFEGRVSGELGAGAAGVLAAAAALEAAGDFQFPNIAHPEFRIEGAKGRFELARGELRVRDLVAQYDSLVDRTGDRGTISGDASVRLDAAAMPFEAEFELDRIPAGRELAAPLARAFPLFSGDFKFAALEGGLGGKGKIVGNASDWRSSLQGDVHLELTGVRLVGVERFAELLSLLDLKALDAAHDSWKEALRIEGGKVVISALEIDGDPTRLPLFGSVGFDGAIDAGIDLGRARLPKQLEPYRPIVALFSPRLTGTVQSPSFAVRAPTPQKLLEAAARVAAGSVASGRKLDVAKLASVGSLADLHSMAGPPPDAPASMPRQEKGDSQLPASAPASPGALPAALEKRFRALCRGKSRFDYAAITKDPNLGNDLRAWLEAPSAETSSKDAALADALHRYEVALALAVAKEMENPLFQLTARRKGIYGLDGFFGREVSVSGSRASLEALAARIRSLGGEIAPFAIAGAAVDLPCIDRAGFDAKNVRGRLEERAREYLSRSRVTPKKLLGVPAYAWRAYGSDEAKIRPALEKWLPTEHPCRALPRGTKITPLAESLEIDAP